MKIISMKLGLFSDCDAFRKNYTRIRKALAIIQRPLGIKGEKIIKSHCKRSCRQGKWEKKRGLLKWSILKRYIDILSRHLLKYVKLLYIFYFSPFSKVPIFSISVVTSNKTTVHVGLKLYKVSIYLKNVPYIILVYEKSKLCFWYLESFGKSLILLKKCKTSAAKPP